MRGTGQGKARAEKRQSENKDASAPSCEAPSEEISKNSVSRTTRKHAESREDDTQEHATTTQQRRDGQEKREGEVSRRKRKIRKIASIAKNTRHLQIGRRAKDLWLLFMKNLIIQKACLPRNKMTAKKSREQQEQKFIKGLLKTRAHLINTSI